MILKLILFVFICYLPVYLLLLFILKTKVRGYKINAHVVSLLATSDKPWKQIFNISTILYGLVSFVLPVTLLTLFGINTLNLIGAFFLVMTGLATTLVGVFPMDGIVKIHEWVSYFVFSSTTVTGVVFVLIFHNIAVFPELMTSLTYIVICLALLLGLNSLFRKKTSSFFEWTTLIGTILWNFALSVSLFKLW